MGTLTKKEESIIRKIVATTEFKDAFLATLIDENTNAIALEWNPEKTNFKIIVRPLNEKSNGTQIKVFDDIKEIIFLLKYLEDERYIYLFENINMTKDNCLYDRNKYFRKDDGKYWIDEGQTNINGKIYQTEGFIYNEPIEIPCDFGKYVQHFGNGIFHVSGSLRELVEYDFKTSEQIRHEQAIGKAKKQINIAWGAFVVSLIALIITSTLGIWQKYSETKIDHSQLDQIKQTIEQKTLPEVFKTKIINDTLTTKVVEMPKVKPNR
jgi:hypothetical protein